MLRLARFILTLVATLLLAFGFLASGFFLCCLPVTTQVIASLTSGSDHPTTPFSHDQLVETAIATRDYTVGNHDLAALYEQLWRINQPSTSNTETKGVSDSTTHSAPNAPATQDARVNPSINSADSSEISEAALKEFLDNLSVRRVLDEEAIAHLDDVNALVGNVRLFGGIGAATLIVILIILGLRAGKRWVGTICFSAGLLVLVGLGACGLWALIDFNGFFSMLHEVFFPGGNWSFPMDSLLITLYPTNFWIAMGLVWLGTSVVFSVVSLLLGKRLRR